jgi:hypothetical protein
MIINVTLYFNNMRLVFFLLVFECFTNPWHDFSHVLNCTIFLDIVNGHHLFSSVMEISIQVVSVTSPNILWVFVLDFSPMILSSWIIFVLVFLEKYF